MKIPNLVLAILSIIFGIVSTISLFKEAKQIFKTEEIQIIFYTSAFVFSISLICDGIEVIDEILLKY